MVCIGIFLLVIFVYFVVALISILGGVRYVWSPSFEQRSAGAQNPDAAFWSPSKLSKLKIQKHKKYKSTLKVWKIKRNKKLLSQLMARCCRSITFCSFKVVKTFHRLSFLSAGDHRFMSKDSSSIVLLDFVLHAFGALRQCELLLNNSSPPHNPQWSSIIVKPQSEEGEEARADDDNEEFSNRGLFVTSSSRAEEELSILCFQNK